jgi:hypothetical protein
MLNEPDCAAATDARPATATRTSVFFISLPPFRTRPNHTQPGQMPINRNLFITCYLMVAQNTTPKTKNPRSENRSGDLFFAFSDLQVKINRLVKSQRLAATATSDQTTKAEKGHCGWCRNNADRNATEVGSCQCSEYTSSAVIGKDFHDGFSAQSAG